MGEKGRLLSRAGRAAAGLAIVASLQPGSAAAQPLERPVASGYFFSQTAGGDGATGYRITNEGGVRFWDEFQRLGGVPALGYPVGRRFEADGFVVQPTQKGVLQWRPEAGQAWLTNVFDEMHDDGKDAFLQSARATPPPLNGAFDAGKDWNGVVRGRLALLDANPAIKARYDSVANPMTFFGLPTSAVVDNGSHYAIRLQRGVIQQWKVGVPWAKAGETTVANGGDVAKEAGLFPADALRPETPDGAVAAPKPTATPTVMPLAPAPTPVPSAGSPTPPATAGSAAQTAVDRVNYYRGLAGLPPLKLDGALTQAASAHSAYYRLNFGDGTLAGMGLHQEVGGRPGFTGQDWSGRAKAAGYAGGVDENIGLLGNPSAVIDAFVDTINHRWNMLHPSAVAAGYGMDTQHPIDVLDLGFSNSAGSTSAPTVYPGPSQRGVPRQSGLWESPDPAPGVPRPVGYPITATFPLRANVTWGDPRLFDDAAQPVAIAVATKPWLRGQAIVPKTPLKGGTTYRAVVRGTVDGRSFEYTWSFTTG